MHTLPRWIAQLTLSPLAVLTLQGVVLNAQAFTDANADMKELTVPSHLPVPARARPARAAQVVWVPASPKALDSFKPVLPTESVRADGTRLAKADPAARTRR